MKAKLLLMLFLVSLSLGVLCFRAFLGKYLMYATKLKIEQLRQEVFLTPQYKPKI